MADKAMFKKLSLAVLMATSLVAGHAMARSSDRNQPIDISANQGVMEQDESRPSVVTGNVVITQGSLVINASKGVVTLRGGEPVRVVLTGGPVRLQQTMDNGQPLTVNASQADYNLATDIVTLTGNVRISQPSGNLSAPSAVYNMGTGRFESQGSSSGRVKMRFVPKNQRGATS